MRSDRSEWNHPDTAERMNRLIHALEHGEASVWVESVEEKPGRALDALRVELRQYSGTVPDSVVRAVYDAELGIRNVGGYKTVTVSPVERTGLELDDDEKATAPVAGEGE